LNEELHTRTAELHKVDRLTADRVLELSAEAVDSFHERR
jgi:hypothetical protein